VELKFVEILSARDAQQTGIFVLGQMIVSLKNAFLTAIPAISLKTGAHRPVAALIFAQAQAPLKP
jgi:hypothetical protein